MTIKRDQYEELFDTTEKAALEDELEVDSCQQTPDELVLDKEVVVLFPHEYEMMLDTLECDILIAVYPGSGEMFEAVLGKHRHGVAICATKAPKTLIHNNLRDWVRRMNLVNFSDRPAKPRAMLDFERLDKKRNSKFSINVRCRVT